MLYKTVTLLKFVEEHSQIGLTVGGKSTLQLSFQAYSGMHNAGALGHIRNDRQGNIARLLSVAQVTLYSVPSLWRCDHPILWWLNGSLLYTIHPRPLDLAIIRFSTSCV